MSDVHGEHSPKLPKQVVAAGKAADAAMKALQEVSGVDSDGGIQPPNPDAATPSTVAADDPVATPPVDSNVLNWETEYKSLSAKFDKLQSRFDVMQGKYNSEVPALHDTVKALTAENESLKAGGASPSDGGVVTTGMTEEVPDEIKDLYGEDLISWIQGRDAGSQQRIKELSSQLDELGKSRDRAAVDGFFIEIEKAHSDWKVINRTDAWISFMGEVIPGTGMTRQKVIDNAQDVGNPEPIIAQLTAFKERSGSDAGKRSQVVPADAGGAAIPPTEGGDKTYLESTVKKFYQAASQGKYATNKEEYNRLDRLYTEAAVEGRITPGR